jgi:cytochrome oxidase Cu insertion factor (SCO1/SenC/PrrC family)
LLDADARTVVALVLFLSAVCAGQCATAQTPPGPSGTGYTVGATAYDFTAPDQNGVSASLYSSYVDLCLYVADSRAVADRWCIYCKDSSRR